MTNCKSHGAAPWFSKWSSIKTIVIGDGVTSVGNYAFYCCYNVTSVTIPDSMETIGSYVFYNCRSITDVYPDGTETLGVEKTRTVRNFIKK